MPGKPRLGGANAPAMAKRPPGEPAMLNEYNKEPLDWIDLDDVQVCRFFLENTICFTP